MILLAFCCQGKSSSITLISILGSYTNLHHHLFHRKTAWSNNYFLIFLWYFIWLGMVQG